MGLAGGFLGLSAVLELVLAVPVLAAGAGGWPHAALLLASVGAALALGLRYYRSRRRWTEDRLDMTNDLVERMVGHRTRLAQEPRPGGTTTRTGPWSATSSRPGGWTTWAPASRSWRRAAGCSSACSAWPRPSSAAPPRPRRWPWGSAAWCWPIGPCGPWPSPWRRSPPRRSPGSSVGPLWRAAGRREPAGQPDFAVPSPMTAPADGRPRLDARDLVYRYHDRGEPVLRGATVVHRRRRPASCFRADPGAASRRWPPCWRGCGSPSRGCCSGTGSTGGRWGPRAGGAGWPWRRSSTRTTS